MSDIAVPFSLSAIGYDNREELLQALASFHAKELFATVVSGFDTIEDDCRAIREHRAFFEERGITFTVWIGGSLAHFPYKESFGKITELDGRVTGRICPTDRRFTAYYTDMIRKIALAGAKRIALDDDFRMNFCDGAPSCFCDKHLALYSELIGRRVTLEDMRQGLACAAPNPFRTAWRQGIRDTMCDFARSIRSAADSVDKSISICLCSGPALWGADGADALTLCEILSGDNPRLLRLSGGPYWGSVAKTADMTRHEAYECRKKGIYTYAEDDVYTRPRYAVPASHAECYDLIIRLDGYTDAVQKYGLDYVSSIGYERGYAEFAAANNKPFEQAAGIFKNKKQCGIQLFLPFELYEHTSAVSRTPEADIMNAPYISFFNDNSFPVIFDGETDNENVCAVFGENARLYDFTQKRQGLILDAVAAKILTQRGYDVGLYEVKTSETAAVHGPASLCSEYFPSENEQVALYGSVSAENIIPASGAEVLSEFRMGNSSVPSAYYYTDADGTGILVYTFDVSCHPYVKGLSRSYCRQRQLFSCYERMTGKPFAAACTGNPDLYMSVKSSEDALSVALINLHDDKIPAAKIKLAQAYSSCSFINCTGRLEDKTVTLDSVLYPFEFAAFELKK